MRGKEYAKTRMPTSKLTVRPAKKEDKAAILDLDPSGKIYDGFDYIPAMFDEFIRDADLDMRVVCTEEGKIVSITILKCLNC